MKCLTSLDRRKVLKFQWEYWNRLKQRLGEEENESVTNCHQLKLKSSDGKYYNTDVCDIEGMFRIIESIPSKNAEPFKLWLAQVGKERIDEALQKVIMKKVNITFTFFMQKTYYIT